MSLNNITFDGSASDCNASLPKGDTPVKRDIAFVDSAISKQINEASIEFDKAVRIVLPEAIADIVGYFLLDRLGPYVQERFPAHVRVSGSPDPPAAAILTFYPEAAGLMPTSAEEVRELLTTDLCAPGEIVIEICKVVRDWEDNWKRHFHPILIDRICIRPPWENVSETDRSAGLIDVVINPGMGFGTGLHPTTRSTLQLLQSGLEQNRSLSDHMDAIGVSNHEFGPLVDAGTGSGILSIAAAKLGWTDINAFDNDPASLTAAMENIVINGVEQVVSLSEADVKDADLKWFANATVLANLTLETVSVLLERIADLWPPAVEWKLIESGDPSDAAEWRMVTTGTNPEAGGPRRLIISGILAGEQERELLNLAGSCGFIPGHTLYEGEWVSFELFPGPSLDSLVEFDLAMHPTGESISSDSLDIFDDALNSLDSFADSADSKNNSVSDFKPVDFYKE